jgi:hypothetical protein
MNQKLTIEKFLEFQHQLQREILSLEVSLEWIIIISASPFSGDLKCHFMFPNMLHTSVLHPDGRFLVMENYTQKLSNSPEKFRDKMNTAALSPEVLPDVPSRDKK